MRAVIALVLLVGCGKEPAKSSGAHAGSATTEGGTTKRSDELLGALIADGTQWKRSETAFGTAELPDGDGWVISDGQAKHPDGTVVTLMSRDGIESSALAELTASWQASLSNRAASYRADAPAFGSVKGNHAARVDASFTDGVAFKMRDYLIITPGGRAAIISGSTPAANPPTRLAAIVDHIAATVQLK